jgi:3-oxoacyl-[acyl-carrier-protein] synthase II
VAITGIGVISAIGIGREAFFAGLRRCESPVRRVRRFDPSPFASQIAAEVQDFNPLEFMGSKAARRLDRFSQFCLAASELAVLDAGLTVEEIDRERTGVYIGSALGGVAFGETEHQNYDTRGLHAVNPLLALGVFGGAGPSNVSLELGLHGPCLANANGCAAGAVAIREAYQMIAAGLADRMIAGGAEAPLAPLTFGAFTLIRALSTTNATPERACRPFHRRRDGFVMGEGAALLMLEELEAAGQRGAHIYAEVLGSGLTSDGYHMTAPLPSGAQMARAIRMAVDDAGIKPGEIDYVNAHASSTPLNDKTETLALRLALGEQQAAAVRVSGTKPYHGHALGASGALEGAVCALAIDRSYVPPTLSLDEPDELCRLNHVTGEGESVALDLVLSNTSGFGGTNVALVFGKPRA